MLMYPEMVKYIDGFRNYIQPLANFTTSTGDRPSPTLPPIVPRIPEIDLINAT